MQTTPKQPSDLRNMPSLFVNVLENYNQLMLIFFTPSKKHKT